MKHLAAGLVIALITVAVSLGVVIAAKSNTYGPLVKPGELETSLNVEKPILLDIRGGKGFGLAHIPGSVSVPYKHFRGPSHNPGQLFDVKKLEAELEKAGLVQNRPIVIVSQGNSTSDFGAAARVYWSLKSTGFTDLAILNGGLEAWASQKLPLSKTPSSVAPSQLDLVFDKTWLADTADVSKIVSGTSEAVLVDARFENFYKGKKAHPAAAKAGTLPGAVNHPYTSFFNGKEKTIQTKIDLDSLKKALGVKASEPVISFCNTGHWAATHWFATSELAGVANAKLYPGSMVEYAANKLPMENVPGWFDNLLRQFH